MWRMIVVIWLLVVSGAALAQTSWGEGGEARVPLYFFWSEGCPHCQEAHPFVSAIPRERPWVVLHELEVSRHPENAQRYVELATSLGEPANAVPAWIFCGVLEVGWRDAATTGAMLLQRLDACRASGGEAGPAPTEMETAGWSLPVVTVVLAGLDAFNPCAFFVLLFLLSLLTHQKGRGPMLLVGGVFVVTSGVLYFAFMAVWLNLFELMGALSRVTLAAGLLAVVIGLFNIKDFLAFHRGPTLSIPETAKPGLYRRMRAIVQSERPGPMLVATLLLAVAANSYELLCTAGFPMVYTRLLTLRGLSTGEYYAYLALYNLIYVTPLLLIVLAFVRTLATRKLSEREGRLLKLMSGVMMLELGLVLTFAPAWLNSLLVTLGLVAFTGLVTLLAARLTRG